jgi:hypothetical protein
MLSAAIEKIIDLARPNVENLNGDIYCDKPMHRIDNNVRVKAHITMTTLTSLIDYIKSNIDRKDRSHLVHIVSPTEVKLMSALDNDRERETLVIVKAEVPQFDFNREIYHESFCIGVQSKFVDGPAEINDKALILKFAGTVKTGSVTEYSDDGVSQKATIKHGVSTLSEAVVPSPCRLTPYRTFIEVEQPASEFIFRLSERGDEVMCALYEADGGAWKNKAKQNIYEYLTEELKEYSEILVIA